MIKKMKMSLEGVLNAEGSGKGRSQWFGLATRFVKALTRAQQAQIGEGSDTWAINPMFLQNTGEMSADEAATRAKMKEAGYSEEEIQTMIDAVYRDCRLEIRDVISKAFSMISLR